MITIKILIVTIIKSTYQFSSKKGIYFVLSKQSKQNIITYMNNVKKKLPHKQNARLLKFLIIQPLHMQITYT